MLMHFGVVFSFLLVSSAFVFLAVFITKRINSEKPGAVKNSSYECGEIPSGSARVNFNPHFYAVAIAFLIFDVEIALIYPVSVKFREYLQKGEGLVVLLEILLFAWVLFLGLVYLWRNGYLDWKDSPSEE